MKPFQATKNLFPAILIALASIALVAGEGHVEVIWADPFTWLNVLKHKCGIAMLVCIGWMLVELARSAFFPQAEIASGSGRYGVHYGSFARRAIR
ncbi:MAG: hypothetical protein PW792_16000 [Acidobacteriaceae bacterium]|nr:hypothetical protein [Acidobacteriaceae bacterium]